MVMHEIRRQDVDTMARTIYGEARGEDLQGMRAVGHVIWNRARNPGWWSRIWLSDLNEGWDASLADIPDDSIEAVCRKPWQFSPWNHGNPNRAKVEDVSLDNKRFRDAFYATLAVIQGRAGDPTDGSTHFYAPGVMDPPTWIENATLHASIGGHKFYTLD